MSEHVPAWKKAGLAVETVTEDATTPSSNKRTASSAEKDKKPPKRQKLPKDKRAPPPESDHLVYIKTFVDDKPNWKFNTVSQQWILKNLFTEQVPVEYDDYVIKYVGTIKGGARDRVTDSAKEIISNNNEYVQWLNADDEEEENKEDQTEEEKAAAEEKKKTGPSSKRVPRHFVKRAHKLISDMTGDEPDVDWEPETAEEPSKPDFIVEDVKQQYEDSYSETKKPQTDLEAFDEAEKNDKILDKAVKTIEEQQSKKDFIVKDVKEQTERDFEEGKPEETPAEEFANAKKLDKELDEAVDNLNKTKKGKADKKDKKDKKKSPKQDFIVKDVKEQTKEDFTEGKPEETPAEEFAAAEKLDKELDKAVDKLHKKDKKDKKKKSPKQDFIVKDVKEQVDKSRKAKSAAKDKIKN